MNQLSGGQKTVVAAGIGDGRPGGDLDQDMT